MQRGRAIVETKCVRRAAESGEIIFKLRHVRPKAKRAVVQRTGDGGVNFRPQRFELGAQVKVRNRFRHSHNLSAIHRFVNSENRRQMGHSITLTQKRHIYAIFIWNITKTQERQRF
jgi:hypothetical protein